MPLHKTTGALHPKPKQKAKRPRKIRLKLLPLSTSIATLSTTSHTISAEANLPSITPPIPRRLHSDRNNPRHSSRGSIHEANREQSENFHRHRPGHLSTLHNNTELAPGSWRSTTRNSKPYDDDSDPSFTRNQRYARAVKEKESRLHTDSAWIEHDQFNQARKSADEHSLDPPSELKRHLRRLVLSPIERYELDMAHISEHLLDFQFLEATHVLYDAMRDVCITEQHYVHFFATIVETHGRLADRVNYNLYKFRLEKALNSLIMRMISYALISKPMESSLHTSSPFISDKYPQEIEKKDENGNTYFEKSIKQHPIGDLTANIISAANSAFYAIDSPELLLTLNSALIGLTTVKLNDWRRQQLSIFAEQRRTPGFFSKQTIEDRIIFNAKESIVKEIEEFLHNLLLHSNREHLIDNIGIFNEHLHKHALEHSLFTPTIHKKIVASDNLKLSLKHPPHLSPGHLENTKPTNNDIITAKLLKRVHNYDDQPDIQPTTFKKTQAYQFDLPGTTSYQRQHLENMVDISTRVQAFIIDHNHNDQEHHIFSLTMQLFYPGLFSLPIHKLSESFADFSKRFHHNHPVWQEMPFNYLKLVVSENTIHNIITSCLNHTHFAIDRSQTHKREKSNPYVGTSQDNLFDLGQLDDQFSTKSSLNEQISASSMEMVKLKEKQSFYEQNALQWYNQLHFDNLPTSIHLENQILTYHAKKAANFTALQTNTIFSPSFITPTANHTSINSAIHSPVPTLSPTMPNIPLSTLIVGLNSHATAAKNSLNLIIQMVQSNQQLNLQNQLTRMKSPTLTISPVHISRYIHTLTKSIIPVQYLDTFYGQDQLKSIIGSEAYASHIDHAYDMLHQVPPEDQIPHVSVNICETVNIKQQGYIGLSHWPFKHRTRPINHNNFSELMDSYGPTRNQKLSEVKPTIKQLLNEDFIQGHLRVGGSTRYETKFAPKSPYVEPPLSHRDRFLSLENSIDAVIPNSPEDLARKKFIKHRNNSLLLGIISSFCALIDSEKQHYNATKMSLSKDSSLNTNNQSLLPSSYIAPLSTTPLLHTTILNNVIEALLRCDKPGLAFDIITAQQSLIQQHHGKSPQSHEDQIIWYDALLEPLMTFQKHLRAEETPNSRADAHVLEYGRSPLRKALSPKLITKAQNSRVNMDTIRPDTRGLASPILRLNRLLFKFHKRDYLLTLPGQKRVDDVNNIDDQELNDAIPLDTFISAPLLDIVISNQQKLSLDNNTKTSHENFDGNNVNDDSKTINNNKKITKIKPTVIPTDLRTFELMISYAASINDTSLLLQLHYQLLSSPLLQNIYSNTNKHEDEPSHKQMSIAFSRLINLSLTTVLALLRSGPLSTTFTIKSQQQNTPESSEIALLHYNDLASILPELNSILSTPPITTLSEHMALIWQSYNIFAINSPLSVSQNKFAATPQLQLALASLCASIGDVAGVVRVFNHIQHTGHIVFCSSWMPHVLVQAYSQQLLNHRITQQLQELHDTPEFSSESYQKHLKMYRSNVNFISSQLSQQIDALRVCDTDANWQLSAVADHIAIDPYYQPAHVNNPLSPSDQHSYLTQLVSMSTQTALTLPPSLTAAAGEDEVSVRAKRDDTNLSKLDAAQFKRNVRQLRRRFNLRNFSWQEITLQLTKGHGELREAWHNMILQKKAELRENVETCAVRRTPVFNAELGDFEPNGELISSPKTPQIIESSFAPKPILYGPLASLLGPGNVASPLTSSLKLTNTKTTDDGFSYPINKHQNNIRDESDYEDDDDDSTDEQYTNEMNRMGMVPSEYVYGTDEMYYSYQHQHSLQQKKTSLSTSTPSNITHTNHKQKQAPSSGFTQHLRTRFNDLVLPALFQVVYNPRIPFQRDALHSDAFANKTSKLWFTTRHEIQPNLRKTVRYILGLRDDLVKYLNILPTGIARLSTQQLINLSKPRHSEKLELVYHPFKKPESDELNNPTQVIETCLDELIHLNRIILHSFSEYHESKAQPVSTQQSVLHSKPPGFQHELLHHLMWMIVQNIDSTIIPNKNIQKETKQIDPKIHSYNFNYDKHEKIQLGIDNDDIFKSIYNPHKKHDDRIGTVNGVRFSTTFNPLKHADNVKHFLNREKWDISSLYSNVGQLLPPFQPESLMVEGYNVHNAQHSAHIYRPLSRTIFTPPSSVKERKMGISDGNDDDAIAVENELLATVHAQPAATTSLFKKFSSNFIEKQRSVLSSDRAQRYPVDNSTAGFLINPSIFQSALESDVLQNRHMASTNAIILSNIASIYAFLGDFSSMKAIITQLYLNTPHMLVDDITSFVSHQQGINQPLKIINPPKSTITLKMKDHLSLLTKISMHMEFCAYLSATPMSTNLPNTYLVELEEFTSTFNQNHLKSSNINNIDNNDENFDKYPKMTQYQQESLQKSLKIITQIASRLFLELQTYLYAYIQSIPCDPDETMNTSYQQIHDILQQTAGTFTQFVKNYDFSAPDHDTDVPRPEFIMAHKLATLTHDILCTYNIDRRGSLNEDTSRIVALTAFNLSRFSAYLQLFPSQNTIGTYSNADLVTIFTTVATKAQGIVPQTTTLEQISHQNKIADYKRALNADQYITNNDLENLKSLMSLIP